MPKLPRIWVRKRSELWRVWVPVTASEARANLYRPIDETNESHRPVVIARGTTKACGVGLGASCLKVPSHLV